VNYSTAAREKVQAGSLYYDYRSSDRQPVSVEEVETAS
jgi:hypothetical protein